MSENKKILAVSCHPADVFDNAGGTLINHIKRGDEVTLVTITHGAFSHAGIYRNMKPEKGESQDDVFEKIIKYKTDEVDAAAKIIGIHKNINLNYDDEPLLVQKEVIYKIAELIQCFGPDIIITHHPREYVHLDHAPSGEMTLRAIKLAGRKVLGKENTVEVRTVYMFGQQGQSIQNQLGYNRIAPDIVIGIDDVIELKAKALSAFKSQRYTKSYLDHRLKAIEGEAGFMHGYKFAEQFTSLYPIKSNLLLDMQSVSVYSLIQDLYEQD